jgi:SAM-dependent methyltransferase
VQLRDRAIAGLKPMGNDYLKEQTGAHVTYRLSQTCYLCGGKGTVFYEGVSDALFGVKGRWNFRRCDDSDCGLMWLDPMPEEGDMGALYDNYYTHDEEHGACQHGAGIIILGWSLRLFYSLFKRVTFIRRQRKRLNLMYLDRRNPGRLLEIGCGNGRRLAMLRKLGWEVEGQEIDPLAAAQCKKKYDLGIHMGILESLGLPDDVYDAVILNHVIEHVHDPVHLLKECRRVMKSDGVLTVVTPNLSGYGHSYFLSRWRGLEPPRHLYLFSPSNLQKIAEKAGFSRTKIWTTAAKAETFARSSLQLSSRKQPQGSGSSYLGTELRAMLFQVRAWALHWLRPLTGEECVLRAFKQD